MVAMLLAGNGEADLAERGAARSLLQSDDELAALGAVRELEFGQGLDRARQRDGPSDREFQPGLRVSATERPA
jgi:hypothetical protein